MAETKTLSKQKQASRLPEILLRHESDVLRDWLRCQLEARGRAVDAGVQNELREQSKEFLRHVREALQSSDALSIQGGAWNSTREFLTSLSAAHVRQGLNPSETAMFVLSLKEPIFTRLQAELGKDSDALLGEIWNATLFIDQLGLVVTEAYVATREEVILRQQHDVLELSTPVVALWKDILALPLIGTLDSARTQVVMESLLNRIVETGARIAILDITGVQTVDTLVAQHLLKTVAAARLMGADCIISGIRPQIAQTIVHLGVDLSSVTTKATMADAFATALQRTNQRVTAGASPGAGSPARTNGAAHVSAT